MEFVEYGVRANSAWPIEMMPPALHLCRAMPTGKGKTGS
jgi:hypothetical protein